MKEDFPTANREAKELEKIQPVLEIAANGILLWKAWEVRIVNDPAR